ncbi:MAG TPA: tetratricopeptide repeat protein [Planctomycetaceae bacterium]|nr:tetratricopeptide repeat protein [Planctomycetaceae bacterium]
MRGSRQMSVNEFSLQVVRPACFAVVMLAGGWLSSPVSADELATAREHLRRGRYEESLEVCADLLKSDPANAAAGLTRLHSLRALGRDEEALASLRSAIESDPGSADLLAELARLHWDHGRLDDAAKAAAAALELAPDQLRARLISADLAAARGQLKEAEDGYRWFVQYYNRIQPTAAEDLLLVGQGAAEYARWKSVSQVFDFVVNTVCRDIEKSDPLAWEGRWLAGSLLLEKYNRAQGIPELQAALAINPQAADVHVLLGESALDQREWSKATSHADAALAIHPEHPAALRLKLDVALSTDARDAVPGLLDRLLAANGSDQRNLARLAAWNIRLHGPPAPERWSKLLEHLDHIADWQVDATSEVEPVFVRVARQSPHPGVFLSELAGWLEDWRKFRLAEDLYRRAIVLMPPLAQPRTGLGMLCMQTGRVDEARSLLDAAFKADPYHLKVSNLRKVIRVLDDYKAVTTDHFVIHADSQLDHLLARYAAEYLEETYADLTAQYGFEPPQRTHIEFYNNARGLSGHQWFSARMVGLPWIQTIGASTGLMIAMTSPTCLERPLHWGRVLRHEFVHVLTLQQTEFNIPHWFTEALAMRAEGTLRPLEWDRLLAVRVAAGKLRNLETLTEGFVLAGSSEEWNFAYCQSALYADYMVRRGGEESLVKLLDAYRRQQTTAAAIHEVFGVDLAEFEAGYRTYLQQLVAGLEAVEPREESQSPAEIQRAYREQPDSPEAAASYAGLLWLAKKRDEANQVALKVLKDHPAQPRAALVAARAAIATEDAPGAVEILERALDRNAPRRDILSLLLELQLAAKNWEVARELCELGQQKFPRYPDWWRGRAAIALELKDRAGLKTALQSLLPLEPDDPIIRLKLAEFALAEGDARAARAYARDSLLIDVLDAETHRVLAEAAVQLKDHRRAVQEYETALELKPGSADWNYELARLYAADQRVRDAKDRLFEAIKHDPQHQGVRSLLAQLRGEE